MAQKTDWLPRRRQDTLSLARTWVSVFREDTTDSKGQTTKKYAAWGIPAETFTEFTLVFAKAEETLTLGYGDSGKKIYMAARLENGDYEGPFGPMISAVIP